MTLCLGIKFWDKYQVKDTLARNTILGLVVGKEYSCMVTLARNSFWQQEPEYKYVQLE